MPLSAPSIMPVLQATARITGLTGSLSPALIKQAAHRLGTLCIIFVVIKSAFLLGVLVFGHPLMHKGPPQHFDISWVYWSAHAFFLGVGFLLYRLSRAPRVNPERVLDLGYIYQVVSAFQVSFLINGGPWPESMLPGLSPAAVWALICALIIPGPPRKMLIATVLTLATDPAAIWLHTELGMPTPSDAVLLDRLMPLVGAFIACVVLSRVFYRMSVQLTAASQMGSYRLEEKLGEGGMGEVWRARHQFLARPAAVKLIRPEGSFQASEASLKRFEREAQATAMLQSPHTVALYDFGISDEGRFYYVMELLDGLDLETLVSRHGPLPPARVVHILAQVCGSLDEAHRRGMVHRDIKPANLLLCRYGGAHDFTKVLDFGLVGLESGPSMPSDARLTQEGSVIGTPAYMAPELALEGAATASVDIYALGCVAFWMLTGRHVFEGRSAMELITRHVNDEPPRPSEHSELEIPEGLDEVVLRCLGKRPSDRFASARALAEALDGLGLSWREAQAERWWGGHIGGGLACTL